MEGEDGGVAALKSIDSRHSQLNRPVDTIDILK